MRARTRFALDIALMIGLVAAYQPTWTGISLHQWLSIAIIAPLLLHVIVNWEWALRVARTFVARLLGASRLNFAIDGSLFLATVAAMLSGFMVSPALIAPLGIHPTNPAAWHTLHSWSANATISLLAVHGLLHWSWFLGTAKRLAESLKPKPRPSRAALRARVLAATAAARTEAAMPVTPGDAISRLRSRVGSRAAQAAAERATALRTASVIGVTLAVGMAIFAGVGMASPLLSPTSGSASKHLAKADLQVCPQTGCAASTCHGTTGADPTVFYGHTPSAAKAPAKAKRQATSARRRSATRVTSNRTVRTGTRIAAAPKKPSVAAVVKARSAAATKRMVCPQTGCSASSCHGAHNQSAASYYN